MTGHEAILKLRRAGQKPAYVWVTDMPHSAMDGLTVRVAGDNPDMLDLRFLVGVTALVEGVDAVRVDRIASACARVAKRVIANTCEPKWLRTVRITDTDGVMTWN